VRGFPSGPNLAFDSSCFAFKPKSLVKKTFTAPNQVACGRFVGTCARGA
jgi:hypothetical protein